MSNITKFYDRYEKSLALNAISFTCSLCEGYGFDNAGEACPSCPVLDTYEMVANYEPESEDE